MKRAALLIVLTASAAAGKYPQIDKVAPPDLSWVPRALKKQPAYKSAKVRYCIWVLGDGRKSVMTLAWDESGGTGSGYDTLYADRNFNGDLTEPRERVFWKNPAKGQRGRPFEQYIVRNVAEAGGKKVFHFTFRCIVRDDEIQYDSSYRVTFPGGGYEVGPLPGNHVLGWSGDLKTAPVYWFGGPAAPFVNGQWPGKPLGTWQAGRTAQAGMITAHLGSPPAAQLRFYGSKFPGLPEAVRGNRWGTAAYPLVLLRVLNKDGSTAEEIPFADSCPCAGGFGPTLTIPSRVPPGKHLLVARMLRQTYVGGPADFLWPVRIVNPDHGKPMKDPAYAALRAKFPGKEVKFATLRRAEGAAAIAAAYPGERVFPAGVYDNTMDPTNRDWDPRPINYGRERMLAVGTKMHSHADSRTLLKFDISGLGRDTKVLGAAVRLTLMSEAYAVLDDGAKIAAYAVRHPWNETPGGNGYACWHGPAFGGKPEVRWAKGGCDGAGTDRDAAPAATADVGGFPAKLNPADKAKNAPRQRRRLIALDVSKLVAAWRGRKRPNHGVCLKRLGSGNGRIASSECLDWPYRPALVVAYTGADPTATFTVPPGEDWAEAVAAATKRRKPLLVTFYLPGCAACRQADAVTFADRKVRLLLQRNYQAVRLNFNRHKALAGRLGVRATPTVVVLGPDGLKRWGLIEPRAIAAPAAFRAALGKIKGD